MTYFGYANAWFEFERTILTTVDSEKYVLIESSRITLRIFRLFKTGKRTRMRAKKSKTEVELPRTLKKDGDHSLSVDQVIEKLILMKHDQHQLQTL